MVIVCLVRQNIIEFQFKLILFDCKWFGQIHMAYKMKLKIDLA